MGMPSNIGYGRVVGRLIRAMLDGPDVNETPDGVPIPNAQVTFTADVTHARNRHAVPPVTIFFDPVVVETDSDGMIVTRDGQAGVWLVATDDTDIDPMIGAYVVTVSAPSIPRLSWRIAVPEGETVDLATAIPVPNSPAADVAEWVRVRGEVIQARDETVAAAGEVPGLVADAVDELAGPLIAASVEAQVPPLIAAQVGPVVDQAVIDADIPGRVDQAIDDADVAGTVSALVDAQVPPLIAAAVAGADIPGVVASEVGPFVAQAEAAAVEAAGESVLAATSATNAATSATNAGTSATSAAASAADASAAATTATTAATAATTRATEAATSASSASTSATNAAGSATTASTKAVEAATSASSASTSASSAATERTGAETARVAAEAAASAAAQPHTHVAGDVTDGVFAPARLGSGTASVATVLRGDGSWGDVPGMGDIAAALDTILNGA